MRYVRAPEKHRSTGASMKEDPDWGRRPPSKSRTGGMMRQTSPDSRDSSKASMAMTFNLTERQSTDMMGRTSSADSMNWADKMPWVESAMMSFAKNEAELDHTGHRFVMTEGNIFRVLWAPLTTILLLYTATIFTYRIVFEELKMPEPLPTSRGWEIFDEFVNAVFWADLFAHFFFSYRNLSGVEVDYYCYCYYYYYYYCYYYYYYYCYCYYYYYCYSYSYSYSYYYYYYPRNLSGVEVDGLPTIARHYLRN